MFRNNYDNDSVTFSPQGRIFQVEYASEAVKQGSVVVGIVSKTHAVLAAVKVRLAARDPQGHTEILTSIAAQRRRAFVLPEEDHPNRLSLRCSPRRSCLRRPRSFQLHETAIARLPLDLRPRYPPLRDCIPHCRSRTDKHTAVRKEAVWCRATHCRCRCEGPSSIRVPA